jgi:hypothetical protein
VALAVDATDEQQGDAALSRVGGQHLEPLGGVHGVCVHHVRVWQLALLFGGRRRFA